jgi:hypothetical protein
MEPPQPSAAVPADPAPAVDPPDPTPAPPDAVPLSATAGAVDGLIEVRFPAESDPERILAAVGSVTEALQARPGSSSVVLCIPVAGVPQKVRVPHRVRWDDGLSDFLVDAATGMELDVRLTTAE